MIDDVVDFLAVFRLTRLMTEDRVPLGPLRDRLQGGYLAELLDCPWCSSIWAAGFVFLVARRLPGWKLVSRALAASAAAGVVSTWVESRS